jgi:MFS family permease
MESNDFFQGVKTCLSRKDYVVVAITFAIVSAVFSSLTTLLNNIFVPYGYSDDEAGIMAALIILGGLVGAGIVGPIIDRTGWHVRIGKAIFPVMLAMYIAYAVILKPDALTSILIVSFLVGFFTFALLPVGLEMGVESAYPVTEGTAASLLWLLGQFLSIILQLSMNALRDESPTANPPNDMRRALILAAVVVGVGGLVFVFGLEGRMYRREAERLAREGRPVPHTAPHEEMISIP